MRNINTWLLFVFLVYLATTGGKESVGEEVEEEVEEEEISRLEAPVDDDDVGDRERRGLYGGSDKEEVCPQQCLCLSEIQVINNPHHGFTTSIGKSRRFFATRAILPSSPGSYQTSPRTSASPTSI